MSQCCWYAHATPKDKQKVAEKLEKVQTLGLSPKRRENLRVGFDWVEWHFDEAILWRAGYLVDKPAFWVPGTVKEKAEYTFWYRHGNPSGGNPGVKVTLGEEVIARRTGKVGWPVSILHSDRIRDWVLEEITKYEKGKK